MLQLRLHKKLSFPLRTFFSKCAHLLNKYLMENFIFCAVLESKNNKCHKSFLLIETKKKELAISIKKDGTDRLSTSPNVSRLNKKSVLFRWINYDNLKNKSIGVI